MTQGTALDDGFPRPDALVTAARERSGLEDLGEDSWREPLEVLCDSLRKDVDLSDAGVEQVRRELVRMLTRRLEVVDWLASHPEADEEVVDGPVLVYGLPRTGTTALAGMLAEDPATRTLRVWEGADPVPPPDIDTEDDDPRVVVARAAKAALEEDAPELMKMHLIDPLGPEEPHEVAGSTFRTQYYAGVYPATTYGDWWTQCDMRPAFAYERRVLQMLQTRRPPNRWLMKAPYYVFHLDDYAAVNPDARFVVTHRDPAQAVPSVCSLLALPGVNPLALIDLQQLSVSEH